MSVSQPNESTGSKALWIRKSGRPDHPEIVMMLLYARVPHSSVMYNETELKATNSSLKVSGSLWMICYSDIVVPKPLELSNYGSIINARGRWLFIAPNDTTYPCAVCVATVKVGRQG